MCLVILHLGQYLYLSLNLVVLSLDHDQSDTEHNRDDDEYRAYGKHNHQRLVFNRQLLLFFLVYYFNLWLESSCAILPLLG